MQSVDILINNTNDTGRLSSSGLDWSVSVSTSDSSAVVCSISVCCSGFWSPEDLR